MHDFRRLTVWQRAREYAVGVDRLTRGFPHRDGGVVGSQLRRAALSIPSNIAEGCAEGSRKETIRFLTIAARSAAETESHLIIASDMGFVSPDVREHYVGSARTIQRMLAKLIANLP